MFRQSAFVKGETVARDSAGAYLDVAHFPRSLASACHDRQKALIPGEHVRQAADLTDSLVFRLTG